MKILYIFYPSKTTGGAEFLLKRSYEELADEFSVRIIDIKDGWLSENIDDKKRDVIAVIKLNDKKLKLSDNAVLLTPSNMLFNFDKYFEMSDAKVVLWTMQPHNLMPKVPYLNRFKNSYFDISYGLNKLLTFNFSRETRDFLLRAAEKNSLFCVDAECDNALNREYGITHNGYIPIFIKSEKFSDSSKAINLQAAPIKILWIGRIDLEFKIHVLIKFMKDLDAVCLEKGWDVVLSIVGDGPGLGLVESTINGLASLRIDLLGSKSESEMEKAIFNNHIGVAMGTSALEMAARKLPTILLDFSYTPIDYIYNYRLLHESAGYTVGRSLEGLESSQLMSGHKLEDLIPMIMNNHQCYSKKSFNYALENHSEYATRKKLISALNFSELKVHECVLFASGARPYWRRFASIVKRIFNMSLL